jgi:hypothetical protein
MQMQHSHGYGAAHTLPVRQQNDSSLILALNRVPGVRTLPQDAIQALNVMLMSSAQMKPDVRTFGDCFFWRDPSTTKSLTGGAEAGHGHGYVNMDLCAAATCCTIACRQGHPRCASVMSRLAG